jgi:hypothetical protein
VTFLLFLGISSSDESTEESLLDESHESRYLLDLLNVFFFFFFLSLSLTFSALTFLEIVWIAELDDSCCFPIFRRCLSSWGGM